MCKKMLVVLGSVVFLLLGFNVLKAEELEMKPYLYTEDFEGDNPIKTGVSGGKSTINFQGLTEEKAFSGKKSAKFDITFQGGASYVYHYWNIPIEKVPVEGELKMTARVFVEETAPKKAGYAGLGICCFSSPKNLSGVPRKTCGPPTGEWKLLEIDLVKHAKKDMNRVMKKHVWGATADNVGIYINAIGFYFYCYGDLEHRVVLYVDDIKIEGKVPVNKGYKEEAKRRWALSKKKIDEKISSWEKEIAMMQEKIESFSDLSPETETMKQEAEERLFSLKESVKQEKNKGYIKPAQKKVIEFSIEQLKSIISNIEAAGQGRLVSLKNALCYVIANPTVSPEKILPNSTIHAPISDTVSVIACQGEYEPASFVIHALKDINLLGITPTDLKGKAGVIPSKNVDIKIVKCWYDGRPDNSFHRVLVPDLLLNDDTLVRVDYKEKENYLKLSYPEGQKYVWISKPGKRDSEENIKYKLRHGAYKIFRTEDYPVKDSSSLLPVNLPANTNKQFWITLNVPEDAEPGVYKGNINLFTQKESLGSINLRLRVLPFKLSEPYYTSGIYYRGVLHKDYPKGTISAEFKSREQLEAELRNMFAHGVTNPTVYQPFGKDGKELGEVLTIRNKIGMRGPLYYCYGISVGNPTSPDALVSLKNKVKKVIDFVKPFGIEEVYFYGIDEAHGERLKSQRPAWEAIREAGGKIFVSDNTAGNIEAANENFEAMGDIQDLCIAIGCPSREKAAKWHSVGHKIFCYGYPFTGDRKEPAVYRKNYGLLLWQADYDGHENWAFQGCHGKIWSPFDGTIWNFTYPTVNGVIDTIAWEGLREGVDDVRYLTTLLNAIELGKKSKDGRIRQTALSAEEYLDKLKESNILQENLGNIRFEMINYILQLTGGR